MENITQQLTEINSNILLCMDKINEIKPVDEQFYILVLELQDLVGKREVCLRALVSNQGFINSQFLVEQFNFTQILMKQSTKVMDDCKALVQVDNNAKRQIKAYKAIESNR